MQRAYRSITSKHL